MNINNDYQNVIEYLNKQISNMKNMNIYELNEFQKNICIIEESILNINKLLKNIKNQINTNINLKCTHVWYIDRSFRDEHTTYMCRYCGNYK
jgi:hypothetical protein